MPSSSPSGANPAAEAATSVGATGATATSTRSTLPAEGRPTVTLRVVNQTKQPRFTEPGRGFFDAVELRRKVGDKWTAVRFQTPTCSEPCPPSKPRCSSAHCSPPMPRPEEIAPGKAFELGWGGQDYEVSEDGSCWCHREVAAPLGSYRLEVCVYNVCQGPDCPPGTEVGSREKLCFQANFEHTGRDQVVAVAIDK